MAFKCLYLQNGTYNALDDRMLAGFLLDYSSDPLSGTGRITSGLLVSAQATPNMTVQISPGRAIVPTPASDGGAYAMLSDAPTTVNISPVSTLPRVDLVVLRVDDADYVGAVYNPKFDVITGTPAASPVAPAQPAGTLLLATLNHLANATSVAQSAIARNSWNTHEAEYYATAVQSMPTGDRPIAYGVAATTCPDVTPLTSTSGAVPFGAFRLNRDGVWSLEGSCRFAALTDGIQVGIWMGLDGSGAFRFAAQLWSPGTSGTPGTGGTPNPEMSINVIRRMGAGSVFNINGYCSAGPKNTDPFSQCIHFRATWLRN